MNKKAKILILGAIFVYSSSSFGKTCIVQQWTRYLYAYCDGKEFKPPQGVDASGSYQIGGVNINHTFIAGGPLSALLEEVKTKEKVKLIGCSGAESGRTVGDKVICTLSD